MPAGDSMPDTYIAIMLQSLKKKEQVLDELSAWMTGRKIP